MGEPGRSAYAPRRAGRFERRRRTSTDMPMAKGQKKSNKEIRKPKAEKAKPPVQISSFIHTPGKNK